MLGISKNHRYLLKDGIFFPYLADTAWTIFQRLTRDEIIFYLDKREAQGFRAIQACVLSELDGIFTPSVDGLLPFCGGDVTRVNDSFFEKVLFFVDECEKRNMVAVLLPTWGDKFNKKWGIGPEIFNESNARFYGRFLAQLIGSRENVIFMLGGDRPIETKEQRSIIDEMAAGIKEGEKTPHLITYHPCGEASSADYFADCDYIDFHSLQSGHSFGGFKSERMIAEVLKKEEKPCLDAESFYEDFPIDFDVGWCYRLNSIDISRRIYRNLMAGSLGTVYGHQSVWCFRRTVDEEYSYTWEEALDRPAAWKMANMNRLLSLVDITKSHSCSHCINGLARESDSYLMLYAKKQTPCFFRADEKIRWKNQGLWFDILSGEIKDCEAAWGQKISACSPFENDGILILYKEEYE